MDSASRIFRCFNTDFCFDMRKGFYLIFGGIMLSSLLSCSTKEEDLGVKYTFEVARDVEYGMDDFDKIPFVPGQHLDLGFYEGSVWIKLEVENVGKPVSLVVLCGDLINRNYRIYKLDTTENKLCIDRRLNSHYYDYRTYNFPKPNFQIDLKSGEKGVFFISTTSDGRILQASPRLISLSEFLDIKQQTIVFDIVFYGSITILLLINFLYFQSLKNNIYYFYGGYIVAACIMYLFVEGRLYGLGLSHALIDHLMFISIRIWILTGILFTIRFLEIKETSPRLYQMIIGFLVITLGVTTVYQLAFPSTSISALHMTENLLGFVWIILSLLMVGTSYKKQKLESKYFLTAYSTFLIFVTLGLIDSHKTMLPGDPFSYFKIGTVFEFIGFTYFIALLIRKRLKTSEQFEIELNETRLELGEKEKQLDVDRKIKKTDFANIFKLVESSLSSGEEWDDFKVRFEALHPYFYSRLIRKYPELTKSEIRLVLLIHIGYSQKEMSKMLSIAPDSVKKGRTRVRKKMGIPSDVGLEEFLLQFS